MLFRVHLSGGFRRIWLQSVPLLVAPLLISSSSATLIAPGVANARHPDIVKRFSSIDVQWGDSQSTFSGGIAMKSVSFAALDSVVDIAQSMSEIPGIFDRILTVPGQIVLSGLDGRWHWLAVLEPHFSGSRGHVSAIHIEAGDVSATRPFWSPVDTSRVLSFVDGMGGQSIAQSLHHVSYAAEPLRSYMMQQFIRHGWQLLKEAGRIDGQWRWHKGDQQYSVLIVPHAGSTLVMTQRYGKGVLP